MSLIKFKPLLSAPHGFLQGAESRQGFQRGGQHLVQVAPCHLKPCFLITMKSHRVGKAVHTQNSKKPLLSSPHLFRREQKKGLNGFIHLKQIAE